MLLYHAARHDAMRHNTKKCMALVYAYNVSRIKNSGMVYDSKSSIIVLLSLDKKTERKRCTPAHWGLENRRMEYSKSRCQNSDLGKKIKCFPS